MSFVNCALEHKGAASVLAVLLLYFLAMDVALYQHIQAWPPLNPQDRTRVTYEPEFSSLNHSDLTTHTMIKLYSPFDKLSLKTIMLDPANQYIHLALASMFNKVTRLSTTVYFITPNFISGCHLVIALVASTFISSEKLFTRQIGVLLFEIRTFLDALDGIVARARNRDKNDIVDLKSSGFYVDAISDTLATIALMVGIVYYLQRQLMTNGTYNLLPAWKAVGFDGRETKSKSSNFWIGHMKVITSNKKILGAVLCFSAQLIISALFWDRTITIYYDLLESVPTTHLQGVLQNGVQKSVLMCSIIWFWRLANAHALLEYVLFSVFIDKAWEFLTWIQYLGFVMLICLIFFSEMHYHYAKEYINTSIRTL